MIAKTYFFYFRLFYDRIEIYSSIESTKISVTSGIIRIALRALLEAVRIQTFSIFGVQQIQVDLSSLSHVLWKFVEDEKQLNSLIDEILQSALGRSLQKELMESDVIDLIIEKSQLA